jgi:hypothetical protein
MCDHAVIKGCHYQTDLFLAFNCDSNAGITFGWIVLIFLVDNCKDYFLVERVASHYLSDRHVYYVTKNELVSYKCASESLLCHARPFYGYKFADGNLITMKSALPVQRQHASIISCRLYRKSICSLISILFSWQNEAGNICNVN